MKKLISLVLLLLICLSILVSCGRDYRFFKTVEDAINNKKLLERYEKIGYNIEYYYADGAVDKLSSYLDSDGLTIIYGNGSYTHSDNQERVFRYDSTKNAYTEYYGVSTGTDVLMNEYSNPIQFSAAPEEKIVEKNVKDGIMYVKTVVENNEVNAAVAASLGYDITDNVFYYEYQIDEETLEILYADCSVILDNGQTTMITSFWQNKEVDKYTVPSEAYETLDGSDERRITVALIGLDGTEQERYTKGFAKGVNVVVYAPTGYSNITYYDQECTTDININQDTASDYIVYLKIENK